jgi:hypothetical protein
MQPNRARIVLRRVNDTLRIALPRNFVTQQGLCPGDHVVWEEEDGSVKLKFFKLTELEQLAEAS